MMIFLDILSWICLISGSFFAVVGGVGVVRMPDFFSRLHGGGITDTLGAGLILVGLLFQSFDEAGAAGWLVVIKLLMILFFLLITSPTSCHALAKSAMLQGMRPQLDSKKRKTG